MSQLPIVFSLTLLGGCADPFGHASNTVTPEGAELTVHLYDIGEATLAGQTVKDGDTILVPRDQLRLGVNQWAFETAKGQRFGDVGLTWGVQDALQPSCMGGRGTITGEAGASYIQALRIQDCPLVNGAIEVQIQPLSNAVVTVDGGTVEGNTIRMPVMHLALDQSISSGSSFGAGRIRFETTLNVDYPDGDDWEQKLDVQYDTSPAAPFLDNLPASLAVLEGPVSETPTAAVFKGGGYFWSAGSANGRTLRDVDLFIAAAEEGPRFDLGRCAFRAIDGSGGFSTAVQGIPTTYVAYDRSGTEVARTELRPTGCPLNATQNDDGLMTVGPGDGQIRAWAESLLTL